MSTKDPGIIVVRSVRTCMQCFSLVERQTKECGTEKIIKMISISAFINSAESFREIFYRSFQERLCRIKGGSRKEVMYIHKDMDDFLMWRE